MNYTEQFKLPNGEFVSLDVYKEKMSMKEKEVKDKKNETSILDTYQPDLKQLRKQAQEMGIKGTNFLNREKLIKKMTLITK